MRYLKIVLTVCLAIVSLLFQSHAFAQNQDIQKIKTAWIGEHEKFIVWYAQKKSWDKEHGLELEVLNFNTGKSILDGLKAYDWVLAGVGAVPVLTSHFKDEIKIIAIANNESNSNILYVRKNSPVLSVKGYNVKYPDVYGNPETVRNTKILCTKGSSAHYLLDSWLSVLGLTEKDVKIQFMEMNPAFGAFKGGYGDMVGVWSPYTLEAESLGYKPVAKGDTCKVFQPILLVANAKYLEQNPETVKAFVKMYMQGIEMLRTKPMEEIIPDYQAFFNEQFGLEINAEQALFDLRNHPVFTLDEQLVMFNELNGKSVIQDWLLEIVNFYEKQNNTEKLTGQISTIDAGILNGLK